MDKAELESFRQRLLTERRRMHSDVEQMVDAALRPSDELSRMPTHIADVGSDSFSQELALSLAPQEERAVEQIDEALERIDAGTFGLCEECGQPIAVDRLEALPYAPMCIGCATVSERAATSRQRRRVAPERHEISRSDERTHGNEEPDLIEE